MKLCIWNMCSHLEDDCSCVVIPMPGTAGNLDSVWERALRNCRRFVVEVLDGVDAINPA